jgi:hypothetical protein
VLSTSTECAVVRARRNHGRRGRHRSKVSSSSTPQEVSRRVANRNDHWRPAVGRPARHGAGPDGPCRAQTLEVFMDFQDGPENCVFVRTSAPAGSVNSSRRRRTTRTRSPVPQRSRRYRVGGPVHRINCPEKLSPNLSRPTLLNQLPLDAPNFRGLNLRRHPDAPPRGAARGDTDAGRQAVWPKSRSHAGAG